MEDRDQEKRVEGVVAQILHISFMIISSEKQGVGRCRKENR